MSAERLRDGAPVPGDAAVSRAQTLKIERAANGVHEGGAAEEPVRVARQLLIRSGGAAVRGASRVFGARSRDIDVYMWS